MIITYIMLAVYIAALIYIGLKDHNTEDKDGFIIGDRKVGLIGTLSSISAGFRTGGGLTLLVGGGFALGYGFYNILIGIMIGTFMFSFMAPRARRIAQQKNYITMPEMVKDVIGYKTEKMAAFIVLVFAILGIATQFYVLGKIAELVLNIDPFNSILISAGIVAFYVSLGGYKSIVRTDILQFSIMLCAWLFLFAIPPKAVDVLNIATVYTSQTPKEFFMGIVYAAVLVFAYSDFWQRMFSSKNEKTAKNAIRLTGFSNLLISLPLTFIGMSARGIIPANTNMNNVFMAIMENGAYPQIMISFFTILSISITMSTLDTYSYVFSSTILENFLKISIKHNKKKYIYMSKIIMIVMLLISAVLALTIENVINYLLSSLSLMMVLSPLFILVGTGWIKKTSKKLDTLFMWSLIIAFIIGSYLFIQGYLGTFTMRLVAPGIAAALMLISYLVLKLDFFKKR